MKKKIIISLVVAVAIGGILLINSPENNNPVATEAEEKQSLYIGAVLSLSGYGAQDSTSIKNGLELAKADLEKEGFDITIEYQDDKTDPKQTVSAFSYFSAKNPDAIVGPIWSYLVDAAVPTLEREEMITYLPSSSSEYIQSTSPYLFQGATKNIQAVPVIAKKLSDLEVANVAIINSSGAWGVSLDQVFKASVAEAGVNVVYEELVPFGTEPDSMPVVVTKIGASGAEAILWTGSKEGALALIKRLKELNLSIPVIGTSGLRDVVIEDLVEVGSLPVFAVTPAVSPEFASKYREAYNQEPNAYSDTAYDGLMILAEAKAKTSNKEEMRDYLEQSNYEGFAGTYVFDEKHDTLGGTWTAHSMSTN